MTIDILREYQVLVGGHFTRGAIERLFAELDLFSGCAVSVTSYPTMKVVATQYLNTTRTLRMLEPTFGEDEGAIRKASSSNTLR